MDIEANAIYDYIVVGAGSAGCVLANRLSEDPGTTVLLIEAGGTDDLPAIHNPAEAPTLVGSAVDWAYATTAEPYLNHRQIAWPRGKVLGGSGSTNFLCHVRGNRYDFDHWQELGNQGWSYADVLPYFKKSEHWERGASAYRGAEGPINVMELPVINPMTTAFWDAGVELGWSRNDDYNGTYQEGFGVFQYEIREGERQSTAITYLHPVENRPNLTVWTEILVSRVLFDGTRAVGVAYRKDGVEQQVGVSKEVILSGGAINSPQLLLLSGVGPADHLRALGIRVVADLPGVGNNLHDHPAILTYFTTKPSFSQFGNVPEGVAFIKTQSDLPKPNIQMIFSPYFFFPRIGSGYTFSISLVDVQSRGQLKLRSTDPTQYPTILANYLSKEADLQAFVEAIKITRRLSNSQALAPFYAEDAYPAAAAKSDQAIIEYIRAETRTTFHPVGTCKMGQDEMAVVDAQLRVHGISGLRVVDASIIPTIVTGNTNAATIMIAEKAADLIRM